jgi:hypothetical protein
MKSGCTSKAGMESAQPETKEWTVWEKSAEINPAPAAQEKNINIAAYLLSRRE